MAEDTVQWHVAVGDRVWPELVAFAALDRVEDGLSLIRGLPLADQQAQQASLRDRAGGKAVVGAGEPFLGHVVVHVVGDHKGDEHVRVEQRRH
jgi:hypothetical protein